MIVDGRFYLMTRETQEDVSIQIYIGFSNARRYVKLGDVMGAAIRAATSLGYRGDEAARVAEGIADAAFEGLKAEGVSVEGRKDEMKHG